MSKRVIITDDYGNVIAEKDLPFDLIDWDELTEEERRRRLKELREKAYKDAMNIV